MKHSLLPLLLGATVIAAVPAFAEQETDCYELSVAVTKAVTASPDEVLQVVQREVGKSPACSCEVVKAAIVASEADRELVGQIVSTAVESAPEKMRIIAQCAIAVAPDALPEVQAVIAKLDPQAGDGYAATSEKGGYAKGGYSKGGYEKGGMAKGGGKEGPIVDVKPASPLDGPYLVPGLPFIHPPFETPPSVSDIGGFNGLNVGGGSRVVYGSDESSSGGGGGMMDDYYDTVTAE